MPQNMLPCCRERCLWSARKGSKRLAILDVECFFPHPTTSSSFVFRHIKVTQSPKINFESAWVYYFQSGVSNQCNQFKVSWMNHWRHLHPLTFKMGNLKITQLKRNIIWTKPPFLGSKRWNFWGVNLPSQDIFQEGSSRPDPICNPVDEDLFGSDLKQTAKWCKDVKQWWKWVETTNQINKVTWSIYNLDI